ncbi:MAG: hypothetical protein Q7N87_05200 [Candidatus Uhrbacteria bacterium]|nr:hypothetical protein [Candidatus Uhrbacteria bacterium]MDP3793684.1 hypothetical protein [Candidatus Uhrbacteria bacterium]
MRRIILAGLLGALAGLWEIAVRPFLPIPFMFRPLLMIVVMLLVVSRRSRAVASAAAGAIVMDLYALPVFDFALLRWLLLIFCLDLLIRRVLTHRSWYAAVSLVLVGRFLEYSTAWLIGRVSFWTGFTHVAWSRDVHWWIPAIWDVGFVSLVFFILVFLTQRFVTSVLRPEERSFGRF